MTKLRSKKRITTVLVALMMVFVVGAAFAGTPGVLTISGIVSIDQDLLLEFMNVTYGPGPGGPDNVTSTALRQPGADGRPNQTIIYTIDIASARLPGSANLAFDIENTGQLDAQLAISWMVDTIQEQLDSYFGYDWFTVTATLPANVQILVGSSVPGNIVIDFDPQFDPLWVPSGDPDELPPLLPIPDTGSFEITMDYFVAIP